MAMASRLRSLPVASVRRLCSGSGGGGATLSALIERLPVVTPELSEWEVEWREAREALVISRAKVYNAEFTAAEEGPERTRARLRLEQVVESMGGRQGEGDTTGDESSMGTPHRARTTDSLAPGRTPDEQSPGRSATHTVAPRLGQIAS